MAGGGQMMMKMQLEGGDTLYWSLAGSGRHFASASDLLALTVALARILALKR